MTKKLFSCIALLALALALMPVTPAHAQINSLYSTTASAAIGQTDDVIQVTSATNMVAPSLSSGTVGSQLWVEGEVMKIRSISSTSITVGRYDTVRVAHASGVVIWFGSPNWFYSSPPVGACTLSTTYAHPWIDTVNRRIWTCDSANGTWGTSGAFFVPASNCNAAVSGTAGSGNNTIIADGSASALKASSTNASGSTATFTCSFQVPPSSLTAGKGAVLTDITYLYGVQTTTATSMSASTFKYFQAPSAGTSETASSATLVAAGGTLTQTPVVGSANLTAVSAGQYYTEKVAFGTPEVLTTDLKTYVFTFAIGQSASAAQIVTTPGFWVHYTVPAQPFI